jgi:hypothetical protein
MWNVFEIGKISYNFLWLIYIYICYQGRSTLFVLNVTGYDIRNRTKVSPRRFLAGLVLPMFLFLFSVGFFLFCLSCVQCCLCLDCLFFTAPSVFSNFIKLYNGGGNRLMSIIDEIWVIHLQKVDTLLMIGI